MSCGKTKTTCTTSTVSSNSNCVAEIINHINDMQEAVAETESCPTGCLNPLGGSMINHTPVNTRPVILYTAEGFPFAIYTNVQTNQTTQLNAKCATQLFRVESVDGNCATLRGLAIAQSNQGGQGGDKGKEGGQHKFVDICDALSSNNNSSFRLVGTTSCVTVDLNCFCSVQCLNTLDDYVAPSY